LYGRVFGYCNYVGSWEKDQPLLIGRESNENTVHTILACCIVCDIASQTSDVIFLGDTSAAKDSEVVVHGYVVIEELMGCDRFSCFVGEFLNR
jgi:hypothetical protein